MNRHFTTGMVRHQDHSVRRQWPQPTLLQGLLGPLQLRLSRLLRGGQGGATGIVRAMILGAKLILS